MIPVPRSPAVQTRPPGGRFPVRAAAVLIAGLLPLAAFCTGCGRIPKIIVLTDPLTAAEHLELGVAYERKGELDLAAREYERALRRDKGLVQARVNLGNVRVAKGEYGKARKEYLEALALRPGDPEATNNLAWAAILSGSDLADAEARMVALLAREENRSPALLDTIGVLRMRRSRPAEAEQAFAEAESACAAGAQAQDGAHGCSEEVRREVREHRRELRRRFPQAHLPPLVE